MKKYYIYLILLGGALNIFSSCTKDEDATPSYADQNLFSPAEGDNSQTATLRRNFYSKVGSFLLFNDTLTNKSNGTDAYGNTIWNIETVDLGYAMASSGSGYVYTFKYLTDYASQAKAAQVVQDQLTARLGKAIPYSMLVVDSITMWTYSNGVLKKVKKSSYSGTDPNPLIVIGERCYAISLNGGKAYTDKTYFNSLFVKIVADKISKLGSSVLSSFYSYCDKYYGEYKDDLGYEEVYNDEAARKLGYWQDWNKYFFPSKENDLKMFETAICSYTTAQVEKDYADYPIVIEKFKILKAIAVSIGVKFDD